MRGRRISLARRFADQNEFMTYLTEYERRHQSDRDRLEMMMKYGQTTGCRARFLTRYFGAELQQDCGRCDNCRRGAARRGRASPGRRSGAGRLAGGRKDCE